MSWLRKSQFFLFNSTPSARLAIGSTDHLVLSVSGDPRGVQGHLDEHSRVACGQRWHFATPVGGADRCKTRRCTRAGYLPSQLARSIVGVAMATAMTINAHRRPTVKRHPPPQRRLPQSRPTSVEVGDFLLCPRELELEESSRSHPLFV